MLSNSPLKSSKQAEDWIDQLLWGQSIRDFALALIADSLLVDYESTFPRISQACVNWPGHHEVF